MQWFASCGVHVLPKHAQDFIFIFCSVGKASLQSVLAHVQGVCFGITKDAPPVPQVCLVGQLILMQEFGRVWSTVVGGRQKHSRRCVDFDILRIFDVGSSVLRKSCIQVTGMSWFSCSSSFSFKLMDTEYSMFL